MKMKSFRFILIVVLFTILPESAVQAHAGCGMAVGTNGTVYCVHTKKSQILRITQDGKVSVLATGVLGQGEQQLVNFHFPHHLEIDADDNLYVADDSGGGLWQIKPNGDASRYWPPEYSWQTTNVGVLGDPFALDANMSVYVANHPTTEGPDRAKDPQHSQIIKWSSSFRIEMLVGGDRGYADGIADEPRFGDLFRATLKTGPGNLLYVGESFNIRTVTKKGRVTTLAGSDKSGYADGRGTSARFGKIGCIAISKNGDVFVADTGSHRIRKVTADGMVTTIAGDGEKEYQDGHSLDASFYRPFGIAIGDDGTIFVMDGIRNDVWGFRLRKISTDGKVTTMAELPG